MKFPIEIVVKANSKENKFDEDKNIVYVKEEARGNKANIAVVKLLSKFFKKQVYIKKGLKSKNKIIDVK